MHIQLHVHSTLAEKLGDLKHQHAETGRERSLLDVHLPNLFATCQFGEVIHSCLDFHLFFFLPPPELML